MKRYNISIRNNSIFVNFSIVIIDSMTGAIVGQPSNSTRHLKNTYTYNTYCFIFYPPFVVVALHIMFLSCAICTKRATDTWLLQLLIWCGWNSLRIFFREISVGRTRALCKRAKFTHTHTLHAYGILANFGPFKSSNRPTERLTCKPILSLPIKFNTHSFRSAMCRALIKYIT